MYHALLVLMAFVSFVKGARVCTDENLGALVPASTCDEANCITLTRQQWEKLYALEAKPYTWNIGQQIYVGYCPMPFPITITEEYETGKLTISMKNSIKTGANCSTVTDYNTTILTAEKDPYTNSFTILKTAANGKTYHACISYYEEDGPFIFRTCRVDPPPPEGEAYASIYVMVLGDNPCPTPGIQKFLADSNVDWKQVVVDCV